MAFNGIYITDLGKNLLAKALAGKTLNFTRIKLGDGALTTQDISAMTNLINVVKTLDITKLKVNTNTGEATIETYFSNQTVTTGFYLREIGVYATDPDIGEILYMYGNAGSSAEYIPAYSASTIIERNMSIIASISNATTVTATLASNIYAKSSDLIGTNIAISDAGNYYTGANTEIILQEIGAKMEQKADKESPQFTGTPTINGNEIATINNIPSGLSLGETSSTAYRGDRGKTAYEHSQSTHAPSNAQKNSDITKAEIEAKLTGEVSTHSHASDSTKAPTNHASSATTYGLGTTANYGHVKTRNDLTAVSYVDGEALSAYQGCLINNRLTPLEARLANPPYYIYYNTYVDNINLNDGQEYVLFTIDIGIDFRYVYAESLYITRSSGTGFMLRAQDSRYLLVNQWYDGVVSGDSSTYNSKGYIMLRKAGTNLSFIWKQKGSGIGNIGGGPSRFYVFV